MLGLSSPEAEDFSSCSGLLLQLVSDSVAKHNTAMLFRKGLNIMEFLLKEVYKYQWY